ncbi:MAG: ABC transporter ATP-binding protein [Thermodesulfovibrionia bacterium]
MIRVEGLNKVFTTPGGNIHVLKDINLDVHKGEMVAIMGPSGVGKSTLLHIVGALDRPTSGSVLYNGEDIFKMSDDKLAGFRNRMIGFVFQFHHLLPEFNTIENVMMPALISRGQGSGARSQKGLYKKADALLEEMGLSDRKDHRPGELSGGEQQRVAVARALILEPQVVLADEPTGNLDTKTGDELFNLLKDLNKRKGITFMIVTHNEALASRCDRIIRMLDGRIV